MSLAWFDPCHDFFAVAFTVYADNLYIGDAFVGDQKISIHDWR